MSFNDDIIPMKSARMGDGTYLVLGTSRDVQVVRVSDPDNTGYGNQGWHLIVDGDWWQTYPTKRAALQACQADPTL